MKRKVNSIAVLLCLLICAVISACGSTGATSRFVLPIVLPGGEKVSTSVDVASVAMDADAAYLTVVNVKPWGKFGPDDLKNIEQSLKDTISPHLTATSRNMDSQIDLHLIVRRHFVSMSNTAGAVLACVAWAATTSKGSVIYEEQFYAFDSGYLVTTIGLIKDSVQKAIVRRIATTSLEIALDPATTTHQRKFDKTSTSFKEAVSRLPKSMVSLGDPALMTLSVIGAIIPSGKVTIEWKEADLSEAFDWSGYLKKFYGISDWGSGHRNIFI
jgi:hypothetical protein